MESKIVTRFSLEVIPGTSMEQWNKARPSPAAASTGDESTACYAPSHSPKANGLGLGAALAAL